jgi:putative redox protein
MKAIARRTAPNAFTHRIDVRHHQIVVDEPAEHGGDDDGPSPLELLAASLASCTAVTIEMYAKRKGWDVGLIEVECEYSRAERGCATTFKLILRLPSRCTPEQVEKLRAIAARCPVHRTLDGEVCFEQRIELVEPAAATTGSSSSRTPRAARNGRRTSTASPCRSTPRPTSRSSS